MVSTESISRARELLAGVSSVSPDDKDKRLKISLLVAAAFREVLARPVTVVGGTAEDYWTADEYHLTDLDLVTWSLTDDEKAALRTLGFEWDGKWWVHLASGLPVEIPESTLDGDPGRVHEVKVGVGTAEVISVEDLYLDRVRQATQDPDNGTLPIFMSAVAIAATNYDTMDWHYVSSSLASEAQKNPFLGKLMSDLDKKARKQVRRRMAAR